MPLYEIHGWMRSGVSNKDPFAKSLTNLHAQTFGTDPEAVRIMYYRHPTEDTTRFGGYGFSPAKGFMGVDKTTDYIVVHMDFRGTAEEWQSYCRKLLQLRNGFRSVYLQRLEYEFEISDEKLPGKVVGLENDPHVGNSGKTAPPDYKASLN